MVRTKELASAAPSRRGTDKSGGSRPTSYSRRPIVDPTGTKKGTRSNTNLTTASGKSAKSRGGSAAVDDDSTDSEIDIETVPANLRKSIPLHLIEARIMKKKQIDIAEEREVIRKVSKSTAGDDTELEDDPDPEPVFEVYSNRCTLVVRSVVFVLWALLVVAMLSLHVYTFFTSLAEWMHGYACDGLLLKLEADVILALSPTLTAIELLVLGARSGVYSRSDRPYHAIVESVAGHVGQAKRMHYVQVVNAADELTLIRPGNLHYVPFDEDGDGIIDNKIRPEDMAARVFVLPDTACSKRDPLFCFNINMTRLNVVNIPDREFEVSWFGPDFLQQGKGGEKLDDIMAWPLVIRLLARANVTNNGTSTVLGFDAALEVIGVQEYLDRETPANGAIFLFTAEGAIVAGTGWRGIPMADESTGDPLYQKIWELPAPWAAELTAEVIATTDTRWEYHVGQDLVVMKPVGYGDGLPLDPGDVLGRASNAALRAVVYMPRASGVRPLLEQFMVAAIGVMGAPVAAVVIALMAMAVSAALRCCSRYCSCRCSRSRQDDDEDVEDSFAIQHSPAPSSTKSVRNQSPGSLSPKSRSPTLEKMSPKSSKSPKGSRAPSNH